MYTTKQIAALRYMIFRAKDGSELSKRVLAFLIDSSDGLTKEVCLSLVADREGYNTEEISAAGHGVSDMQSCNGTTHLSQIMVAMGNDLYFSVHYGDFDPSRPGDPFSQAGQFAGIPQADPVSRQEGMPMRYTFWLSRENYSREAKLVTVKREELEQINLRKPGLYPRIEPF
ncbi:MAG: hypothetical protein WAW92_03940 [Minisyncoccia bacterium]